MLTTALAQFAPTVRRGGHLQEAACAPRMGAPVGLPDTGSGALCVGAQGKSENRWSSGAVLAATQGALPTLRHARPRANLCPCGFQAKGHSPPAPPAPPAEMLRCRGKPRLDC